MKRIVAGFLVACMLFSVTACGNGSAQSVEVGFAETMTENSEALTDSESNTEIATSPAAEGMYTYTIYEGTENEMTLSMDVNIDDYVISNSYTDRFFSIYRLAIDLGWLANGDPNYDPSSPAPVFYSYDNGDGSQTVFMSAYNYTDENTPMGFPQINSYNVHFSPLDNLYEFSYPDDSEERYRGIDVTTSQHYDDLEYITSSAGVVAASRDDIVVIAYIFWSASVNPGENCFYDCSLNNFRINANTGYVQYALP